MKNILIPVDYSPFSSSAAKTGIYVARKTGATVHLLNIANAPDDWEGMTTHEQQKFPAIAGTLVEAESKLHKYSTTASFGSTKVVTHVMGGAPYKQIVRYAEEHKIDLIIIGAHGISDSDGLFIGSTAQKVMRIAPCPVLSVKKSFNPNTLKRILFASDFEEMGVNPSFRLIKNFALDMEAKIDFAFVNTPQKFVDSDTLEKRIRDFSATQREIKPHIFIHNDHTKEEGILNLTKKLKSNVIALVTHNRKGKKNYAFGITETILFHSDIPVLSQVI